MSSRRKTSLLEYKELTIKSISRLTSAWYSNVSPACSCSVVEALGIIAVLVVLVEDLKEDGTPKVDDDDDDDDGVGKKSCLCF